MKVEPGKFVAYAYKLYNDADNTLLFEAKSNKPDVMVFGASPEVVPGLITAMEGLQTGDRFGVTLPPEAAFGPYVPEDVVELDKSIFMRDGELAEEVKENAALPMMTADGYRVIGRVLEIGKDKIRMDFNHPFAGMTVRYEGEIVEVRDAREDEIHPQHGCGGCCGGSCGDGCGDGKDGCGCGDGKDGCGCGDDCQCN